MAFTHLHVHSEYSLLDGACRIKGLVGRAKELGQEAVAITDHGVMYGAVNFYKEAKKAGIKPIIGCEVYVAPGSRFDRAPSTDAAGNHLVLLCKNMVGYRNLCRLVSASFTEGFYIKPRIDLDILSEHSEGLIALSACLGGEIPKLILRGDITAAKNAALRFRNIFGGDSFYLELQDHGMPEQRPVDKELMNIAADTGIQLVVTNDAHYLTRADAYKSEAEMRDLFPECPEAADNTNKIAEMCSVDFEFGHYHLPEFTPPGGLTSGEYLEKLCTEGFFRRYGEGSTELKRQLKYEIEMIKQMGFVDYFLIVSDFVAFARGREIPVGPGRGSAAGSVVSYCLGITDVDPIKYSLYFERFLNPERVSMPDIDMDFCERRRGEVIEYVKNKYGSDRVAQIVTFNTLKAKNAVRSVSKALSLSFAEENELAKMIPDSLKITLEDALRTSKQLRERYEIDERAKRVIDTAMAIEDMPKDSGTHAAGVVITRDPVYSLVPLTLSKKDGSIATQYDMTTLEELGLLKMDFLGLRNLSVIDDAVREIRKREPDFLIDSIPYNDEETYAMLSAGKTSGVFQLESTGMTGVCTGLRPKSIEDITAIIALYRPGPMDSIPRFLECSAHPEKIRYRHPMLEPILNVTYGCIVYQEQVIEIFRRLAGFSLGQADLIRRAMSKKKQEEIGRERITFIEGSEKRNISGAVKNGIPRDVAAAIYDEILDFANYAFNKAHAVSYAIVSYQTAYLKCHFPREYMAALMTSVLDSAVKVAEYSAECRDLGIGILPPDVNSSIDGFSVEGDNIRYGLVAVKNIGRSFIRALMEERDRGGKFSLFEEFCTRLFDFELNSRSVESLIKAGAFDSLGYKRSQLMRISGAVIEDIADTKRRNIEGQLDMFGGTDKENKPSAFDLPDIPEYTALEMMAMEREVTGLYLSGHPMNEYREAVRRSGAVSIGRITAEPEETAEPEFPDGRIVLVAGIVTAVKTKQTKNNTLMSYITLEDGTGSVEILAFQRVLDSGGGYVRENAAVIVGGRVSCRDEKTPQIVADSIRPLSDLDPMPGGNRPSDVKLYVRLSSEQIPEYRRIKLLLDMFPGDDRIVLYFEDSKKRRGASCIIHNALINELSEMLGKENVVVK